ncbi:MAG: cytochrome c oxidase subunit 3 [Chitinophagaceae bacterium]|nr:cytochrome c oxidase subunit 3 [Chitinophagaceae bacterium]
MIFAGLTSAYIVKSNQASWKAVVVPQIFWLSTLAILVNSFTLELAIRSFKQGVMHWYRIMMTITVLLGAGFLVLQWMGFTELWAHQVTFKGSGAGQFLYVIFGLHGLHVLGGVVTLIILLLKALAVKQRTSVVSLQVTGMYWHFVDALWIYLLVFFVLIGK